MADSEVQILIRARDEATANLRRIEGQLASMNGAATRFGVAGQAAFRALGDATNRLNPQLGAAVQQLERLSTKLPGIAPALVAVAVGAAGTAAAVFVLVKALEALFRLASTAEQLSNLAQKAGVAASALRGLQQAFTDAGVPAESLSTGLRFLNQAIERGDETLAAMGITTKDTRQALFQLADAYAATADGPAKATNATKLLGRAGQELIPILNRGGAALQAMMANADAAGVGISKGLLARLIELDNGLDDVKLRLAGLKQQFVLAFLPVGEQIIPILSAAVDRLQEMALRIRIVAGALDLLRSGDVGGMVRVINLGEKLVMKMEEARQHIRDVVEEINSIKPGPSGELTADQLKRLASLAKELGSQTTYTNAQLARMAQGLPSDLTEAEKKFKDLVASIREAARVMEFPPARARDLARELAAGKLSMEELARATGNLKVALDVIGQSRAITVLDEAIGPVIRSAKDGAASVEQLAAAFEALDRIAPIEPKLRKIPRPPAPGITPEVPVPKLELSPAIGEMQRFNDELDLIVENTLNGTEIMRSAFGAMSSSLAQAFSSLLEGGSNFGRALVGVFRSMVSAILAELARLLAAKVFLFLIKLVSGGFAAPITGPGGLPSGVGGTIARASPVEPGLPVARAGRGLEEASENLQVATASLQRATMAMARAIVLPPGEPLRPSGPGAPRAGLQLSVPSLNRLASGLAQVVSALGETARPLEIPGPTALQRGLANVSRSLVTVVDRMGAVLDRLAMPMVQPLVLVPASAVPMSKPLEKPPVPQINRTEIELNVSSLDSKSFTDYMTSPLGKGRLAEIRLAMTEPF